MYGVESSLWVWTAEMHSEGAAYVTLLTISRTPLGALFLDESCHCIHDRFDPDQHELLICQLFHMKGVAIVSDYVLCLTKLVDHFTAYSSRVDLVYFTMCFIDGLRVDIKSILLVQ